MDERELTQLLQRAGDRVTPGPAPVGEIVREGSRLRREQRHHRVVLVRVAAIAAAVVGGGSLAATVVDLPALGGADAESAAGGAVEDSGGGNSAPEAQGESGADRSADEGATAADAAADLPITPDVASPGDRVQIDVPPDVAFGTEWLLERSTNGSWEQSFILLDADAAAESGAPLSRRADSTGTTDDIRERKDGPVPLVVPEDATPGTYRICQFGDDGTDFCGSLSVTD